MRKFLFLLAALGTLSLTGCLETEQEVSLKEDGSGTISITNDMSSLIGLMKQMGGGAALEKAGDKKLDSTIVLANTIDSIPNLSSEEREMAKTGVLKINADFKAEKFVTKISFPFAKPSQIPAYNKLAGKIMAEVMKDKMADGAPMGTEDMPEASSIDDYYKVEYSEGELTRKVDKDKYAGAGSDEYLKGINEAASMGLEMKASYVIRLPRPATKAEGKNVKLSDDKKTVTLSGTLEDFFDDPSSFEFKIKY
jgi:hypothetical protein